MASVLGVMATTIKGRKFISVWMGSSFLKYKISPLSPPSKKIYLLKKRSPTHLGFLGSSCLNSTERSNYRVDVFQGRLVLRQWSRGARTCGVIFFSPCNLLLAHWLRTRSHLLDQDTTALLVTAVFTENDLCFSKADQSKAKLAEKYVWWNQKVRETLQIQ